MKTKKRRVIRFPGIVAAAQALGISRSHLWFVLTGERRSPGLMFRYKRLMKNAQLPKEEGK